MLRDNLVAHKNCRHKNVDKTVQDYTEYTKQGGFIKSTLIPRIFVIKAQNLFMIIDNTY